MNSLIIILSLFFLLLGIAGSFIPIIPGPITSWLGFAVLKISNVVSISNTFLITTFIIALIVLLIDYIFPIIGVKKIGGSKKGIQGAALGTISGFLILGPLGLLIGSFLGALLGELINGSNLIVSLKTGIGSLIGFITGVFLKLSISLIYLVLFVKIIWNEYF